MMTSTQIRQSFLDFFKSKQHTIVPSSSLLPDSPNLLFTNAGMNQFVPIFLGQTKCPYQPGRAADTQKCIRAGGKHNDLEDVGLDTYHHTFFEMLGNWSFGDYFKKEAIEWAWELVTSKQWFGFPPERLYATVYKPGKGEPSEFDQEAYDYWEKLFQTAGLDPKVHICTGGKKDNFWMMGDTGPCGPCSEIHVDLTSKGDTKGSLVNKGDARCIEIWNLVFMQFNANPDGTFTPLPARNVDTGMGFERVTSIIQCTKDFKDFANAKISNYETDIFRPIFDKLEELSGKKYGSTLPGGAHAPSRVPDRALAVGSDARQRASSSQSAATAGTTETKYSRRNLPHFERPWAKYMVSFSTRERRQLTPAERDLVLQSVLYAHEHRQYQLYAACVMPDHVHLLFEPQIKAQNKDDKPVFWSLSEILQGIKSASAHNINRASGTTGHVWEQESLDRMIRGQSDLEEKFHYLCRNPWDTGVVPVTADYPWLWTPENGGPRAEARAGAVDEASTAAREARALPPQDVSVMQSDQIQIDVAFRVIADHIRTLSFAIADGIQPGNNDRNYVLRRILRRAVRYGRTLGFHEPFFYKLVDMLADTMGDVFPEIRARKKHVQEVIRAEEEAFNKTLDKGIALFEIFVAQKEMWDKVRNPAAANLGFHGSVIQLSPDVKELADWSNVDSWGYDLPGRFAFKLYDTYGFPLDLTELMARERGLTVDTAGFEKLMDEQRARARAAQKKEVISLSQIETTAPTKFVGYETLETPAKVIEVVSLKDKTAVILDTSACYAEMGGQVGDTGEIFVAADVSPRQTSSPVEISAALSRVQPRWKITNTQKSGNTWLHFVTGETFPATGDQVVLHVDPARRNAIQRHHTVTHLLHWALHEVVNKEASQKGSFVGPDKLTFDFNSAPLTPQQVADVEKLVNERILENAPVTWLELPYAEVKKNTAIIQFFGEKYGDTVRVLQIGGERGKLNGYSMELCGGTHARATGEIGLFRIVGENAIAAGVRRIEAVAGLEAYSKATDELALIKSLAGKVNSPVHELEKKIESLLEHQKEMEKQIKVAQQREASNAASLLLEEIKTINGIPAIIHNLGGVDGDFLQAVADSLKSRFKGVIVLGGGPHRGSVALIAAVTPEFTAKVHAGKIIQQIAPIIGGKGGGKPDNARGGGKDAGKLDEALAKARTLLGS
jgi:alanyl-tRNA synthetase